MRRCLNIILLTLFLFCCVDPAFGQEAFECQGIYPAGGRIGATVQVMALGSFPEWPVNVWCNSPRIAVNAIDQENGQLQVAVSENALPGNYWLRLSHKQKATGLLPFRVGTLTDALEADVRRRKVPHVTLDDSGLVIHGRLEKSGEVDTYELEIAAGKTFVAAVEANQSLGSPMDGVLQLVDSKWQNVVAQNDDCQGLDPRIVHRVEDGGRYQIRLFAFPSTPNSTIGFAGGKDFIYRLTITTGPFVDRCFPAFASNDGHGEARMEGWNLPDDGRSVALQPGFNGPWQHLHQGDWAGFARVRRSSGACRSESPDSCVDHPLQCQVPVWISGRISAGDDVDGYCFDVKKDDRIRIRVDSSSIGFPLDPLLKVYDASGKRLAQDDDSGSQQDASLEFTIAEDGIHRAEISDLHGRSGPRFVYLMRIEHVQPSFQLAVDKDVFDLDQGKSTKIPVKVERRDGFDQEIDVSAVGLANGLRVASAVSQTAGDTSKQVELEISAGQEAMSGPFRIVAISRGNFDRAVVAHAPTKLANVTSPQLWLSVKEQN